MVAKLRAWYLPKYLSGIYQFNSWISYIRASGESCCDFFQVELKISSLNWFLYSNHISVPMLKNQGGEPPVPNIFGGFPRTSPLASGLGSCLAGTLYRMDFELSLFLLRGETRKTPWKTRWRPGGGRREMVGLWLWKLWVNLKGI